MYNSELQYIFIYNDSIICVIQRNKRLNQMYCRHQGVHAVKAHALSRRLRSRIAEV